MSVSQYNIHEIVATLGVGRPELAAEMTVDCNMTNPKALFDIAYKVTEQVGDAKKVCPYLKEISRRLKTYNYDALKEVRDTARAIGMVINRSSNNKDGKAAYFIKQKATGYYAKAKEKEAIVRMSDDYTVVELLKHRHNNFEEILYK